LSDTATEPVFADLFEDAPCGYLVMASDWTIIRVNRTLRNWLELTEGSTPQRFHDLLTTPGRIVFETNVAPLLRLQEGVEEVVLDFRTATGGSVPVQINASSVRDAAGALCEVRVAVVRSGARRRYERTLLEREANATQGLADAQSASLLREQFIAVLGHDLRNPLASVNSGVRLLLRDPSREKAERIASMMYASVLRMSGMIDNVLDFARGRLGGGIGLLRAPTDLAAALTQVTDELRTAYPQRIIEEHYELPTGVDCDSARMSQMISNLVGNACSHGDPATPVVVAALVVDGTLQISVVNNGEAIPAHKLATLFQPFSRSQDAAPMPGLGLGLFIASEIAKSHGGELTVASSEAETRFTFRMPMALA
jgi:sigma-B regulation protein RsbU (phosphoserine phosphatase)